LTIANTTNSDISGYSTSDGTIYIYDNSVNGGNGASEAIFRKLELVFDRALQMAKECKCKNHEGCPLCTHMYNCERHNHDLSRHKGIEILELLNSDVPKTISEQTKTESEAITTESISNYWSSESIFPESVILDNSILKPQHEEKTSDYDFEKELEKTIKYHRFANYGYGHSSEKFSKYLEN
jgi:hypothetical protein